MYKRNVLLVASVPSMIKQFNMHNIKLLTDLGFNVEIACNFLVQDSIDNASKCKFKKELEINGVLTHQVDFARGIGTLKANVKAYIQLKKILKNKKFEFIHTNSPLASVISRLVANRSRVRSIYTAHGFQFVKGGSLKDWLLFFPVEYVLSFFTDSLITINEEDYTLAKKYFHQKNLFKISKVGIDLTKYKNNKRLFHDKTKYLIVSAGELTRRKNHQVMIRAIHKIHNPQIQYLICGIGPLEQDLKQLIKDLKMEDQVHLMGYQSDMSNMLFRADAFALPSLQEGLSVAGMEALAVGVPIIGSNVRGIRDYVKNGINGYVRSPNSVNDFSDAIQKLLNYPVLRKKIRDNNIKDAKKYGFKNVDKEMSKIYRMYIR